jgi:hypothetical protein
MGSNKTIIGLITIGILFFAIILSASIMGVFKGYEPYQQLIAAMLSVAATGVITALLLIFQRKQQEELNKEQRDFETKQKDKEKKRLQDTKIFEEKLRIYKEFLHKLCDVVKDQDITREEEIELQFQVSYIAMHTKPSSINIISDNIKQILLKFKKEDAEANNMLERLFNIADEFHKELYTDDGSVMSNFDREETIRNFKSILIGKEDVQEYEDDENKWIIQQLEEKLKKDGKLKDIDLFKLFKAKIDPNGANSCELFYRGKLLNYEYYTKAIANGKYINSKDTIAIDFLKEGDEFIIRVGTRRNDPEKTKLIAMAIDKEFKPGNTDVTASHWHVHIKKPLDTSNDEMVRIMNELLAKVKAYRDKEYHLK